MFKERTTIIKKSQSYTIKTHIHIPKKEKKKKRGKIIPDVKVILFWPRLFNQFYIHQNEETSLEVFLNALLIVLLNNNSGPNGKDINDYLK